MLQLLTADAMEAAEKETFEKGFPSLVLMERAALSVLKVLKANELDLSAVLVLCGSGNNAADGVALARLLCEQGAVPHVCLLGNPEKYSENLRLQLSFLKEYKAVLTDDFAPESYSLIIDALFGIGLNRPLRGNFKTIIHRVNEADVPVVSIDIPSGLNASSGEEEGCAVHANMTVTFQYAKVGQLIRNGPRLCGELYVENIGILPINEETKYHALLEEDLETLPPRNEAGNKGTFGKVLVIAGSKEICGAAYLSAAAAMKCGIGMVKLFTSERNRSALCTLLPEALITTYSDDTKDLDKLKDDLQWADFVLIGPGIGTDAFSIELFKRFLTENTHPSVLDADALNILSENEELWPLVKCDLTITPHIGELSRLTKNNKDALKKAPIEAATELAKKRNLCCILKDAVTVTAYSDEKVFINTSGSSALSTAGTGDVLAGMVAGYLTRYQNCDLPLAALAVFKHGSAGERAEVKRGADAVMASDLLAYI